MDFILFLLALLFFAPIIGSLFIKWAIYVNEKINPLGIREGDKQ